MTIPEPDFVGLVEKLKDAETYLDLDALRMRREALEPALLSPDLWEDRNRARQVTKEFGKIGQEIDRLERIRLRLNDARILWTLAVEEGNDIVAQESVSEARLIADDLRELQLQSLLGEEHDAHDAVCEIHAGEGGTDAQDWAEILLRMYTRWAERQGLALDLNQLTAGQEAGIQSATFTVRGEHAYGLLVGEKGVHRLYRISPFDSQSRRQTSYAAVDVLPLLEYPSGDAQIADGDLRVDTYRSSGAGGQHVNVTDSAVRLTHLPTGVVVACQNQRSQLQNKAKAMQLLVAKLAELARQEHLQELRKLSGEPGLVSRGGAIIRGYVLAPHQIVTDERTGFQTTNVKEVLAGDLDDFIESYLRWRRVQGELAS